MASWLVVVAVAGTTTTALWLFHRVLIAGKRAQLKSMIGKTVIVTGANTGIGKATALELAKLGARVILACRDAAKADKAVEDIRKATPHGELVVKKLDLASFGSVKQFCKDIIQEEPRLDVLINNAGVLGCPYMLTEDGVEMHMAVNHFGPFLLTNLLLDLLKKSDPSRIVFVSSMLSKRGTIKFDDINSERRHKCGKYYSKEPYANSKLANAFFARELDARLQQQNDGIRVGVHTLHPGIVRTDMARHVLSKWQSVLVKPLACLLVKSPFEGCQTVVHCATAEELEHVSGRYYGNCTEKPWNSKITSDNATPKKLWELSERLTGLA